MVNGQAYINLMQIERSARDRHWLERSLQAAIQFTVSTLPLYLCSFWSIKDDADPVRKSLQIIILEEMLHLGWICNFLVALGGVPKIKMPQVVPTYPLELSGPSYSGQKIHLQAFSNEVNCLFMKLERPEASAMESSLAERAPSMGAFFAEILAAYEERQPPLSKEKQVEAHFGPLGLNLTKISSPEEVRQVLMWIRQQGKGSLCGPEETGTEYLVHYYRFAEISCGRKLQKSNEDGCWEFSGEALPFPDVWPMAPVPAGGYQQSAVPDPAIWRSIEDFDRQFTGVLGRLESAWQQGDSEQLRDAVRAMNSLQEPAVNLMQVPLPSRPGTYGPCFRLT